MSHSVHLSSWPDTATMPSNQDLMHKMHIAQRLSSMVLGIRKAEKIRVRQPLSRILVPLSTKLLRVNAIHRAYYSRGSKCQGFRAYA